jgi:hypothetical protein
MLRTVLTRSDIADSQRDVERNARLLRLFTPFFEPVTTFCGQGLHTKSWAKTTLTSVAAMHSFVITRNVCMNSALRRKPRAFSEERSWQETFRQTVSQTKTHSYLNKTGWGIFNRNSGEFSYGVDTQKLHGPDWGDGAFTISANSTDAEQARLFIRPTPNYHVLTMLASSSLLQNATGGVWGLHSSCGEFSYSMAGAGPSAEFPEALLSDRPQKFTGTPYRGDFKPMPRPDMSSSLVLSSGRQLFVLERDN